MKETKSYWYHNTACLMEPYFVNLDFSNLLMSDIEPPPQPLKGPCLAERRVFGGRSRVIVGLFYLRASPITIGVCKPTQ